MLFPTVGFAVFLSLVFVGAWLLRPWPQRWRAFLLFASIVFFGWWDWRAAAVLVGIVLVTHIGATVIATSASASVQQAAVGVVGAAGVATFVIVARVGLGGLDLGVIVPLGLGLLVLRSLSYVIDVYRGTLEPAPILDAALALSFFPAVVAGPLVRASELLPQLAEPPDARRVPAARAFRLLLVGLFEVWVIAAFLRTELVDPVFAAPSAHSGLEVLVATYGFTVQLFAELAGYASMAIGAALLLGLRLPENFEAPLVATSLRSFWHRWTSTFTGWLRDYLYVPLGGDRYGEAATARNVVLTFVVAGLWFAGGWTGLAWGVAMGVALAVERSVAAGRTARLGGARAVVGWLVTINVVAFGWLVLRAGNLADAGDLLGRLASWGDAPLVTPLVLVVIVGVVAAQLVPRELPSAVDVVFSRLPIVVQGVAVGVGLLVIDALGQGVAATGNLVGV